MLHKRQDCLYGRLTKKNPLAKRTNRMHKPGNLKSKTQNNRISNTTTENLLPFIIPFYKNITILENILTKNWNLIINDIDLKNIFTNKPFIVYKRHKRLKDFLMKTRFSSSK